MDILKASAVKSTSNLKQGLFYRVLRSHHINLKYFRALDSAYLIRVGREYLPAEIRDAAGRRFQIYGVNRVRRNAFIAALTKIERFAKTQGCDAIQLLVPGPKTSIGYPGFFVPAGIWAKTIKSSARKFEQQTIPLNKATLVAKAHFENRKAFPNTAFGKAIDYKQILSTTKAVMKSPIFRSIYISKNLGCSFYWWICNPKRRLSNGGLLWVAPSLRGQGLAQKMMIASEHSIANEGGGVIWNYVSLANKASINLHKALGYRRRFFVFNKIL